jgi:hypothetical protein
MLGSGVNQSSYEAAVTTWPITAQMLDKQGNDVFGGEHD